MVVNLSKKIITIKKPTTIEFEEKKSKFIGHISPIDKEADAIEFINKIKTQYWDATHNVYAYYLEKESCIQRYSDDGEPTGTAGIPVLDVIKKAGVQDVCIVVTRYFGGIMLGASGLVRAYGKSASQVVKVSELLIKMYCIELIITLEYSLYEKLNNYLRQHQLKVFSSEFNLDVDLKCYIPVNRAENIKNEIIELLNDRVLLEYGNTGYFVVN